MSWGEWLASKLVIIVLALALTASLAGAAIYYTQTNPSQEPSGSERFQVLIVTSANMEPTIMEGNKILVDKQISPRDLRDNYPNSDIIVYYKTSERNELIVSRIVAVEEVNGKLVFYTKGDANGANKYPDTPSRSEYDPWTITEDLILGRVIDTDFK
jgi:signal peptidase I